MKRKSRIAAAALAFFLLTGCGSKGNTGITSGMANSSLFNDMQKGEAVEAEAVTEAFNTALENADASVSATIDTQVSIELTENGETISSKSTTQIKYQPDGDKSEAADATEEENAAEDISSDEASDGDTSAEQEPMLAYVNINNEYNGESNTMEGFYQDGYLYYTLEENKVKEPMGYSDLMYIVSSYAVQFDAEVVDSAYKVESKEGAQYTIKFDPNAMADMMMNNMAGAGSPMDEDESMIVNEAYLYFAVDDEGCLSGFDMELDAKFTAVAADTEDEGDTAREADTQDSTGGDSPFKYSVVANFSDLGSTEVTPFEELDSYEDVNTVLERMQAEEAETEEGETAEADTEAVEAETEEGETAEADTEAVEAETEAVEAETEAGE